MTHRLTSLFTLCTLSIALFAGQIGEWTTYLAYNNVTETAQLGQQIFALAGGSLYSVDTQNGSMAYYNKQNSLHGSTISHIAANKTVRQLAIFYADGLIDLMDEEGNTHAITDLLLKDMSASKQLNSVTMYNEYAYCAMPFGIMVLNLKRKEITGVYYIGKNGNEENILQIALQSDSIYAITADAVYAASLKDNVQDYSVWNTSITLPSQGSLQQIIAYQESLFVLQKNHLFHYTNGQWTSPSPHRGYSRLRMQEDLFCFTEDTLFQWQDNTLQPIPLPYTAYDALPDGSSIWIAAGNIGMVHHTAFGNEIYQPDGPAVNSPYRMKIINDKLYVVPGGRWAVESRRPGYVMIYDGQHWTNIMYEYFFSQTGIEAFDLMNVAVDPQDEDHFYVTSFGLGLYEFQGTQLVKRYERTNSPLASAVSGTNIEYYVRTDGAMFDDEGNLWVLNTSSRAYNIHILSPAQRAAAVQAEYARWDTLNLYSEGNRVVLYTPQEMFIDQRYRNWKWIPSGRSQPGIVLLDDNGTPARSYDDRVVFRTEFVDQDGNTLRPEGIYAAVQDRENTLWIGTNAGIMIIPSDVDFRTSNRCERIKIARNDGTNLADYLLSTEQVNAIAIDGSNRKWIGTEGSGVYLMSADGTETIEHFTTDNSPLLSDKILSIAIHPSSGLVYIGTENGLMSYQSDASEPEDSFSSAYAFPNPVREDYEGVITIAGLMEETVVHIIDQGGNLVCETRSNGGMAVWDGKNGEGKRVSTGVYTALCNTANGKKHTAVKILIIH